MPAPGLTVTATPQQRLPTALSGLGPQRRTWLPAVLDHLQPTITAGIRQWARRTVPAAVTQQRHTPALHRLLTALDLDRTTHAPAATAAAATYVAAATKAALQDPDTPPPDALTATLTTLGTGDGPLGAGLAAVDQGPLALCAHLDRTSRVPCQLDGPAWRAAAHATRARSLTALATLGDACAVTCVVSPRLAHWLRRHHPDWAARHLTGSGTRGPSQAAPSRSPAPLDATADPTPPTAAEARQAASEYPSGSGPLRIVAALDAATPRRPAALAADPAVDLARGSVGAYLERLAQDGLVAIDRTDQYNTVTLTPLGARLQAQLTAGGHLPDATQATLEPHLTPPSTPSTGTVGPAPPADAWLAATGDADGDAAFVQGLAPDHHPTLDAAALWRRARAPVSRPGVTVVEDRPRSFADGRVGYWHRENDQALAVCEWGGPLVTLVRLCSVLLSDRAWARGLTARRLGDTLEAAFENVGPAAPQLLRRASQVGWCAEGTTRATLKARLQGVRRRLLGALGDGDAARTQLFRDAHGLLASAVHLYHAAGLDLQVTLRFPDGPPAALAPFLRHTVPKAAGVGIHSAYRHLCEPREPKRERAVALPEQATPPTATPLVDWVLVGPDADALATAARDGLTAATDDTIADPAVTLAVPVTVANGPARTRALLTEQLARQGYATDGAATRRLRRLTTICERVLGGPQGGASPYAVAAACRHLPPATRPDSLPAPATLAQALGQLPAARLLPDQPPTCGRLFKALCTAPTPCPAGELRARADVSTSAYHAHRATLLATGLCRQTAAGWVLALGAGPRPAGAPPAPPAPATAPKPETLPHDPPTATAAPYRPGPPPPSPDPTPMAVVRLGPAPATRQTSLTP